MILTVTPNPALDLTWHVDGLVPGASHRVDTGATRAGGKGINVARVLHGEGQHVHALTTRGGRSGEEFAADLGRSGIPATLVEVTGPTRRSVAVVDSRTGEATLLNERGTRLEAAEVSALLDEAGHLGLGADAVAISGSLPPGFASEQLADLVVRLDGYGVPVVADVGGDALIAASRARATVVKPNRDELAAATGESDPSTGARRLQELGAQIIVASLGVDGLLVLGPGERLLRAHLGRTLRGNPTGAGDAVVAAVALWLAEARSAPSRDLVLSSLDTVRLARRAVAWSASAVLMPLAGEIHPDHAKFADEIRVDVLGPT